MNSITGLQVVAAISKGKQKVWVLEVEGLKGYELKADSKESLPLAVELAIMQVQDPQQLEKLIVQSKIAT